MDSTLGFFTTYLAAVYDCGAYNAGTYNEGEACTTTTTTSTSGTSGGSLVDTGSPVFLTLVAGSLLVAVALAIIVFKLVRRKQVAK